MEPNYSQPLNMSPFESHNSSGVLRVPGDHAEGESFNLADHAATKVRF